MADTDDLYPIHAMLTARADERNTVQAVIDWLDERGWTICREIQNRVGDTRYTPIDQSKTQLMAEYFDVDLQAFDDEKLAMLAMLAAFNAATDEAPPKQERQ